jgi:hypothetical protein
MSERGVYSGTRIGLGAPQELGIKVLGIGTLSIYPHRILARNYSGTRNI